MMVAAILERRVIEDILAHLRLQAQQPLRTAAREPGPQLAG
jgi:hypothetical protein